jgi:Palmitoyl protein thioesterase
MESLSFTKSSRFNLNWIATILIFVILQASIAFARQPPDTNTRTGLVIRSWVNHERYSGTWKAQPSTQNDYKQLAYELQGLRATRKKAHSRLSQQQPYVTVSTPRNNIGNRVPLSLLHWERTVDAITPEQQTQALSTGVTPEPIITNVTLFAVSPVKPTTYRGASLEMMLSADDFFEEVGNTSTIQNLRIDAGDGIGWQPLILDEPLNVSYDTTGTKTVEIEAELSDGTILQASSQLDVMALATPDPTLSVRLVAPSPYNNTTGTIYIYKSGPHTGLRCPVLVAEGFDMENNMDAEVLYNILNEENLAETLSSYGRDLIVLDYANAMRNITENAALARAAINYINANRQNSTDKFTVIGASMGGLVTRIALADMDSNPVTYGVSDVDTWISFDSPHKGANIPLGIQEFLAFFYNKDAGFAAAANLYNILNQPAAKQMLLVHQSYYSPTLIAGNTSNTAFQALLDTKGYPTSCRKIAVSNGSGYGYKHPFNPGDRIVFWSYRSFLIDMDGFVYALSPKQVGAVPTVFYGLWNTILPFDEIKLPETHYYDYSLDNAPGGTRNSFQVLYDSTVSYRGSSDYCLWPDHCFIPTVSSLGLGMVYSSSALHYNDYIKSLSPFDEIHYPYYNEPHIDINSNNKRWFIRAILEDFDTDADGFDDYQEYLMGTAYNSASSKLTVASNIDVAAPTDELRLTWNWLPNVSYKIYFTDNLAHDWTLVDSAYWYFLYWPEIVESPLPMTTPSGFYKVVADVVDPVTD